MSVRVTVVAAVACLPTFLAVEASETAVYQNDFNERQTRRALPGCGNWVEAQPYGEGTFPLCNANCSKFSADGSYAAYQDTASQDGWFTPYWSTLSDVLVPIVYRAAGDDNPCMTFRGVANDTRRGYVLRSLRNVFTNGCLRLQFDFRMPYAWLREGSNLEVFPVYDAYMDVMAWNKEKTWETVSPGAFGVRTAVKEARVGKCQT